MLTNDDVLDLWLHGQYFDAESRLTYNVVRNYEVETGRYIQSDPIGLAGGPSTYRYADANPLRYDDTPGFTYAQQWTTGGAAIGEAWWLTLQA